jgi:hypothetical protein
VTDHEPDTDPASPAEPTPDDSPTMVRAAAGVGAAADAWPDAEPLLDEIPDAEDEWVPRTTGGIRFAIPAALLIAVALIAGGFFGGVELEKGHSGGGSTASGFAALSGRLRTGGTGASGASGAGGFAGFGGSSAAATGSISVVDGNTLYVLTGTGSLVKVTLAKSTTITRNADTAAVALRPGDTVTVQGATSSNGDVAATSVSSTAAGVSSSTASGFPGGAAPSATSTTSATTTTSGG